MVELMPGIEKPFSLKLSLQCQNPNRHHSFLKEGPAMATFYLEENKKNIIMLWRVICDPVSLSGIYPGYSVPKSH